MGGVHPTLRTFLIFLSFFEIRKNILSVLSKLSEASFVNIFYFSNEWKVVFVAAQRRCTASAIKTSISDFTSFCSF